LADWLADCPAAADHVIPEYGRSNYDRSAGCHPINSSGSGKPDFFLLSLVAGLGTGIGGLLAVIRKPGKRSFGFLMGITAGVMITLSFMELVNEAWKLKGFLDCHHRFQRRSHLHVHDRFLGSPYSVGVAVLGDRPAGGQYHQPQPTPPSFCLDPTR
jgi:hypothetical protein